MKNLSLKKYKSYILELFYNSIDRDFDKWREREYINSYNEYESPTYDSLQFDIRRNAISSRLILNNLSTINETTIVVYRYLIFPTNFKVYRYVRKIRKKFNKKSVENKIKHLKIGLTKLQSNFVKEVRKSKLKKLSQ